MISVGGVGSKHRGSCTVDIGETSQDRVGGEVQDEDQVLVYHSQAGQAARITGEVVDRGRLQVMDSVSRSEVVRQESVKVTSWRPPDRTVDSLLGSRHLEWPADLS